MKIKIDAHELKIALIQAARFCDRRVAIPVLGYAKLTAEMGQVEITTTNIDAFATFRIEAKCLENGSELIPIRQLLSFVREVDHDAEVEISGGPPINISSKVFGEPVSLEIKDWIDVDDFPSAGDTGKKLGLSFTPDELKAVLWRPFFAVSTEETRYYLNGVYLHFDGKTLRSVATDGHRLALHKLKYPDAPTKAQQKAHGIDGGVIVPRMAVERFISSLPKSLDNMNVNIHIGDRWIDFNVPNAGIFIKSKLIDGTFPDYARVLPRADLAEYKMTVEKAKLLRLNSLVSSIGKISNSSKPSIKIIVDGPSADIKTYTSYTDSFHARMAVQYSGRPFKLGVRCDYLKTILGALKGDMINISIFNEDDKKKDEFNVGRPLLLTSKDDPAMTILQMPMRV